MLTLGKDITFTRLESGAEVVTLPSKDDAGFRFSAGHWVAFWDQGVRKSIRLTRRVAGYDNRWHFKG